MTDSFKTYAFLRLKKPQLKRSIYLQAPVVIYYSHNKKYCTYYLKY